MPEAVSGVAGSIKLATTIFDKLIADRSAVVHELM